MNVKYIPLENLAISFIPVLIVLFIFYKWELGWKSFTYATGRMLIQLLTIGYFLTFIFNQNHPYWTILIVLLMLSISSWISLHSIKEKRQEKIKYALTAIFLGAIPVLLLVTQVVIPTSSWYTPSFLIPLAGMIFSNAMNTIGVAAERFESEIKNSNPQVAKRISLKAALIPQINTFLAVGMVSLPGMMTGQILSGVDPLIAVRYQIVVMTMLMGAGGLSTTIFLHLSSRQIKGSLI